MMHRSTDILLVTTTEVETLAVLEVIQQHWFRRAVAGLFYYDLGVVGGATISLVQSEMGAIGLGASAQTVEQGIAVLNPIAVIMVGIAFGMQERTQRVGDVLVARQLLLYEPQRVGVDAAGQLQVAARGARADVSPWLLKAVRSGGIDWKPPTTPAARTTRPPRVHIGLILSGEKLIDNLAVREQLRLIGPEAIGGEMEGAGLYVAAQQRKVDWILIKAICDWADGNKAHNKQHRQRQAARNAAHFVLHVIRESGITRASAPLPSVAALTAGAAYSRPLHQLRAPVDGFVGRTDIVVQIAQKLNQTASTHQGAALVGICGMGGVGKTELAYVVANQVASSFPDAQIVLDLRGTHASPLTPEQVLQTVLRAFTPHALLPEDLPALEVCYRNQLHDKRVLIIADDACDAAQVRPLIPPVGCALVITSRSRFLLPGMTTVDLEQLAVSEAVELLQQSCSRLTPGTAALLARACGCLPLALRVSGSLLHTTPALAVGDYLASLADTRQRLRQLRDPDDPQLDVAATLALSYAQLDRPAQQVFCQLGVLAGSFATEMAQAVVQLPERADLQTVLYQLLRRNLVMYDPSRARWCLHDLVRDLALHYLEQQGAREVVSWRYARVAVRVAQTIAAGYSAGGDQAVAALALFDAEQFHIDEGYHWALANQSTIEGAQLLLAVALATTQIGELRLDAKRNRLPRLARAFRVAQQLSQHEAAGSLLLYLGRAAFDLGHFQQAIRVWERAQAVVRQVGDRQSESLILGNLGTAYTRLGDSLRAIAAYEQALAFFRVIGDQRRQAHVLGNLGALYGEQGNVSVATRYLGQALTYARSAGDLRFEGMLLNAFGHVFRNLGAHQRALSVCEAALVTLKKIGDRQHEGYTLTTLGRVATDLGEHARASAAFDRALILLQEVGDRWGVAECRWHYGVALVRTGDWVRALPLLRASVAYRSQIGHARVAAHAALLDRLRIGEAQPALLAVG